LLGALDAGVLSMLRRFRLTLVAFAVALAIGLAAAIAGIVVPTSSYNAVFDSLPRLGGMLKWGVWNLAAFEFALGVTLFAAVPVALSEMLRTGRDRPTRVTGTVISTLSLSVLGSVALLSASPYGLHILHERNLFYVTPLLATGVAHWLSVGLPRPRWLAVGTACATVVLAVALPVGVILHPNVVDSPTAGFWLALKEQIPAVPVRVWTILLAGIGAVTFLVAKRPLFPVLTMLLAFAAVTSQTDYRDGLTADQAKALAWVDHALPPRATSTLIHLGLAQSSAPCAAPSAVEEDDFVVWTEYFNTRIDSVEHVYAANPRDGLGSRELTVGSGGIILDQGKPFRPAYLVIDSRQPIVGTRLQRFDLQTIDSPFLAGASLTLWRVDPPLRFYSRPQPLPPRADGHQC